MTTLDPTEGNPREMPGLQSLAAEGNPAVTTTRTTSQLEVFAGALFEPSDVVEVRTIHDTRKTEQRWFSASELPRVAASLGQLNRNGYNLYAGINPRKSPGGSHNSDVACARTLFVDFDGLALDEVRRRIDEAALPAPSMIVNSGHGFHCYWLLDEPLIDLDLWSRHQQALIGELGSDPCIKDAARIMRLPGFLNVKGDPVVCDIVDCDPARQYPLDEFPRAAPRPRRTTRPNDKVSTRERENAINYLAKLKSERADEYASWISVGMVLHSVDLSDSMLTEWDRWSRSSEKWQEGICGDKWTTFSPNGSLTIATLHQWANEDSDVKLRISPTHNKPLNTQELAELPLTDTGNAERLVARHGNDLRYSRALGWLCWDGRRWKRDDTGEADRRAKHTVRELYKEAASLEDADKRRDLAAWAKSSESAVRRRNLLDMAKCEATVVVTPDELDQDDFLLNITNGTINLRTGELQPHGRADLITKLAPVEYDPDATCPTFDRFLDETVCGRKDLALYLQEMLGMCLSGDITEQILVIAHGDGSNGKNTLFDLYASMAGDYAAEAAPDLLVAQRHRGHPTEIADLFGKRFVIASETEHNEHLRVQFVKRITGDARLKGRYMHKDFFEFRRTCKVVLVTNNRPVVSEQTHAIWRRLRLVPFDNVVADQDQDKSLPKKLRAETSGILLWLIQGCLSWQRDGLTTPQEVLLATDEYRAESNWLERFVEECLTFAPELWSASARITDAHDDWCREVGVEGDMPALRKYLRGKGCTPKSGRPGRGWKGVGIVTNLEVPD